MFPNGTVSISSIKYVDVRFQNRLCLTSLQNNPLLHILCQPLVFYELKTLLMQTVRRQI